MALPPGFAALDFSQFHTDILPGLAAARRDFLASAAARLSSLALELPGGPAFTYHARDGGLDIVAGSDAAATVIEIDLESWQGLVHELEAPAGLMYARRVRCLRGHLIELMAWESALRALYNGRPPYDPAQQSLLDRHGDAIDRGATFTLASDRDDMAHFLRTAGYLFVRDVFRAGEIAAFLSEAAELRQEARQGDKLSWWGKNAAGDTILNRVTRGITKPHLATLPADARLQMLKELADDSLVYRRGEGQGVTVIYKQPNMAEGLGDLPWHRDCGMGGHAVICPVLLASIYLTPSTPETGELAMMPGSHRAAMNAYDQSSDLLLHAAHFRAAAGDVSLHFSDTVHVAPSPTDTTRDNYRISAVVGFARPDARHHRGERSYNDVLHQRADGQIEHLGTIATRT